MMNSAMMVDNYISDWKTLGLTKVEMVLKIAEACIGWPYVWGGYGQYDTPSNRDSYASRSTCPSDESSVIRKKCQVLNGSKDSCSGCKYYPSAKVRFFDCRGFTRGVSGLVYREQVRHLSGTMMLIGVKKGRLEICRMAFLPVFLIRMEPRWSIQASFTVV